MAQIKRFVVTGTRVYGPEREDSDLDIVLFYWDCEDILVPLLERHGVKFERQSKINPIYAGIKFSFHPEFPEIQIICVETEVRMDSWEYATQMMCGIEPIDDRKLRIHEFQTFRNEYLEEYEFRGD